MIVSGDIRSINADINLCMQMLKELYHFISRKTLDQTRKNIRIFELLTWITGQGDLKEQMLE